MAAGTITTCARTGLVPFPGGRNTRIVRLGAKAVATTLLARGGVGAAVSAFGLGGSTPAFRRWNLAVYSPLCLALGAAARQTYSIATVSGALGVVVAPAKALVRANG